MNDLGTIESKLAGPVESQQRRARLLAELWRAFSDGGPQAVTGELNQRMTKLEADFAGQLEQLKKQL
jgi:hypothetical protein